jgi:5-methyltetrahydropteroyltriglutamate--homocysteine methyltransferase
MPLQINIDSIWDGARQTGSLLPYLGMGNECYEIFKEEIISTFIDKVKAGVDIPNYPQFRDMNEMFFSLMNGFEKQGGSMLSLGKIKAKPGKAIPETEIIRRESSRIRSETDVDKVRIKACVTGPYTLASFFQYKSPSLYKELGHSLTCILRESIFNTKSAVLDHISIDEPVLGFMNDPLLDYGSDGRESLCMAWEEIAHFGSSHGIDVSMHLHDTSENLFWEVEHLGILASHVGDPIYTQESTKTRLKETDKNLWVAIGITQYDTLIENYYKSMGFTGNIPEKIGEVWTGLKNGNVDPYLFLEEASLMRKRLEKIVGYFGLERISYASLECGLNSFPNYSVAIECLRRASSVISAF